MKTIFKSILSTSDFNKLNKHWTPCPNLEIEAGFPNLLLSTTGIVRDPARYQRISDHPEIIKMTEKKYRCICVFFKGEDADSQGESMTETKK